MSCMEHECERCHKVWFDNKTGGDCPDCGSSEVYNIFDEEE